MNLQRVAPAGTNSHMASQLRCIRCNTFKPMRHMLADLDGVPFKDYICDQCAMLNNLPTPDHAVHL